MDVQKGLRVSPLFYPLMMAGLMLSLTGCASTGGKTADAVDTIMSAEHALNAGDAAARAGEFERALAYYLTAASREATPATWLRIGAASTELGESERALHAYVQVLAAEPENVDALEAAGLEAMKLGQEPMAREYLQRALDRDPQRWRSHNSLGILADRSQDHAAAIAHYEAALAINSTSAMLRNNIGYSRYLSGDLDQAARDFYTVTQAHPDYAPAWSNLAMIYADRGWYDNALETLGRVTEKAKAHNDVGHMAFVRGDLATAERLLTEAIRLSPVFYQTAHRQLELVKNRMREQDDVSAGQSRAVGAEPTASLQRP